MGRLGKSLLFKYILSYISISVLACGVVGLPLLYISSRELGKIAEQTLQIRLGNAATDLEGQLSIMEDMAYHISVSVYFQPAYLEASEMNKLNTLKYFATYRAYSPIVSDYFYYHRGDNLVWKPNAANSFDTYITDYLSVPDPDGFAQILNTLETFSVYKFDEESAVLLFPVKVNISYTWGQDAVVGFIVKADSIRRRLSVSSGGLEYPIHVYLTEKRLFSFTPPPPVFSLGGDAPFYDGLSFDKNGRIGGGRIVGAKSSNGDFAVLADGPKESFPGRSGYFAAVILCAVIFISLVGCFLARWNYQPIYDLVNRFNAAVLGVGKDANSNELGRINSVINEVLEKNRLSENQINEQMKIIHEQKDTLIQQFFLLALNGETTARTALNSGDLGIRFPGDIFCVYVVKFDGKRQDRLFRFINELSDEDLMLHCVALKQNDSFVVVVNTVEDSKVSEAEDLIGEILLTEDIRFSLSRGRICNELENLHLSLVSALPIKIRNSNTGEDAVKRGEATVAQLTGALSKNDIELAHRKLDELVESIGTDEYSFPQQYYIFAETLVMIIRGTAGCDTANVREKVGKLLLSNTVRDFHTGVSSLLDEIHLLITERESREQEATRNQVMAFVRQHALEYDLDFCRLSEQFKISPKGLRQIIRNETGRNLREILNTLRIEEACKMLVETDMAVSDISRHVGFLSVSYFIKVFRTLKQFTPVNYRIQFSVLPLLEKNI